MLRGISLSRMAHGQPSIKKAIGVLKDSTTVGLAKVNNDKKEIDVAIVKATNHENVLPKEKHIRTIFAALSSRTSDDVAYCIHALAKRLSKTHSWAVALKTLIVLHRATREVDFSFCEELISYTRNKSIMHRLSRFTDDSSENAWSYSAWVRTYALYLEERLECLRILNYDVETNSPRAQDLDAPDLFDQLPALQQLLSRLLACQPEGVAKQNSLIKYALTIVTSESVRLYVVITDGVHAFVDKFYKMHRHDAYKALDIYRTAGNQAERLSEFYETYKNLGLGQDKKLIKVEPPPSSFLTALENYVKESPQPLGLLRSSGSDKASKDGLRKGMDEGAQKEKMKAPGSKDGSIEKTKVIGAVEKLTLSDAKGEIMQDRY